MLELAIDRYTTMNAPPRKLETTDLLPADVLLSRGDSDISTGIVELDGGTYSHAALWSGAEVIESTLPYVREAPLHVCGQHALFIDVYRHVREDLPREDIVSQARTHLGKRYGTLDLGVATFTVAVSSWMPGDWAEMNSLYGSDRLARVLHFLSSCGQDTRADELTCSELVATAFFDAQTPLTVHLEGGRSFNGKSFTKALSRLAAKLANRESLATDGQEQIQALANDVLQSFSTPPTPELPTAVDLGEWQTLRRNWMDRTVPRPTEELAAAEIRAKRLLAGITWSTNLVTPRLLERSSDLRYVGRVWDMADHG